MFDINLNLFSIRSIFTNNKKKEVAIKVNFAWDNNSPHHKTMRATVTNKGHRGISYKCLILVKPNGEEFLADFQVEPFFLRPQEQKEYIIEENEIRNRERYRPGQTQLEEWLNKDQEPVEEIRAYVQDLASGKAHYSSCGKYKDFFFHVKRWFKKIRASILIINYFKKLKYKNIFSLTR